MCTTKKIVKRRGAFTLVEMLVVIVIILVIAALAAAFAPRVTDNQNLTRAVDNLEQWLLTAKMRAKRDGLATGIRFIQGPGDANIDASLKSGGPATVFSQFQYIQQPEPLAGGWISTTPSGTGSSVAPPPPFAGTLFLNGTMCLQTPNPALAASISSPPNPLPSTLAPPIAAIVSGQVQIYNFDPTMGSILPAQWLVQTGDYLELWGGGVYAIAGVSAPSLTVAPIWPANGIPVTTLTLFGMGVAGKYGNILTINPPGTTNFRILRQPRILIGEEPLVLPNNYAANFGVIPGTATSGCNVALGTSGYPEVLFSPTGAVVGTNAGNSTLVISVWDTTMDVPDPNRVGIVGIQGRSGFMGAYGVSLSANPFFFVQTARESGL